MSEDVQKNASPMTVREANQRKRELFNEINNLLDKEEVLSNTDKNDILISTLVFRLGITAFVQLSRYLVRSYRHPNSDI